MSVQECLERRVEAAEEFDRHEQRADGARICDSLSHGLSTLRAALFKRIHEDVERHCGTDSMLSPISLKDLQRMETASKVEIEIYQVAVVCEEVRDRGLVSDNDWFLGWFSQLRLGALLGNQQVKDRLSHYLDESRAERRVDFGGVLIRTVPEAAKAPLVLYKLFPYSIRVATNVAFGDHLTATEVRNQQTAVLPHILDCRDCHGRPLENGDQCPSCGNPVWIFEWLRESY